MNWSDGLFEMFLEGFPKAVSDLCPEPVKRKLRARLQDYNPYTSISTNHDLVRATRLAWVEACQALFKEARAHGKIMPADKRQAITDFDDLVLGKLKEIRAHAFDRGADVGISPIDNCVETVLVGVPELVSSHDNESFGGEVTKQFVTTLAELSGWPETEIPEIYGRIATVGLKTGAGGTARPFGELVFASFAEIIKDPTRYPEAQVAFDVAMGELGRNIGKATLKAVHGLDEKLEAALENCDAGAVFQRGAVEYLELLPEIAAGVGRIEAGVADVKSGVAEIKDHYRGELERAQKALNASESDLVALLASILEQRVAREGIEGALETAYGKLKELRESRGELAGLGNEMPQIMPLLAEADDALQAGEGFSLERADRALARADEKYVVWIEERDADAKRGKENRVKILVRRIKLAEVEFDYSGAEKLLRQHLDLMRDLYGEEYADTAESYDKLAANLDDQGKYEEAALLLQKALGINERVLGEEHSNTATSYNNMAHNLNAQAKYEEAALLLQKALEISERVYGEEHPDTAMSYNNMAANLDSQGKYWEAEPFYRKALEIRERVLGKEHPNTAGSYNNLAANLNEQAKYEEAELLYQKAVEIYEQVHGEEHPHTALSYTNMANNLNSQGKYKKAALLYQKALEIRERVLGEEHPHTALGYNNLAYNLNAQAKYEEAALLLQKALEISERVYGEEHPDTAMSYNNLAANLNAQAKYEDAAPLYQKAVEIYEQVHGEEHPHTALSYNNLAANLNAQSKYEDAALLYQKAIAIWERVLGEEHPNTALSYNNLAANLSAQRKYEEAELLYQKALKINEQVHGEEHPHTALSYNNMANNLNAQGKYETAEPLFQKALEVLERALGTEHPHTMQVKENLLHCQAQLKGQ